MFPVEAFQATLVKSVAIFQKLEIPFHLTGGITSVLYGEPRMTQDIDIVVQNQALADHFDTYLPMLESAGLLHDAETIRTAIEQRSMFQLLDMEEALKLDIYPRELIEGELGRSQLIEIFDDVRLPVVSRVDAAVSKLIWISKGSHKSRRDMRQIFRTSSDAHRTQIEQLAANLKLGVLLEEVLAEPNEID